MREKCFLLHAIEISIAMANSGASGIDSACQCRRWERLKFHPWVGKIPWRRKRQPAPVFLPGKFHGQRRLSGYSSWGHEESDMTLSIHTHTEVTDGAWYLFIWGFSETLKMKSLVESIFALKNIKSDHHWHMCLSRVYFFKTGEYGCGPLIF